MNVVSFYALKSYIIVKHLNYLIFKNRHNFENVNVFFYFDCLPVISPKYSMEL